MLRGYIRGSIKDMQSLLVDLWGNTPVEEERFSKVEDERVSLRCNVRKVCKPLLRGSTLYSNSH
jgi:hypothetical protein